MSLSVPGLVFRGLGLLKTSPDSLNMLNQPNSLSRFQDKVDYTLWGCWLWLGRTDKDGYGIFYLNGKNRKSHRVSYETWKCAIPTGMTLDHLCRVRNCVNPDHTEPVTNRENFLRGDNLMLKFARATHCKNGHEFTVENTYVNNVGRTCKTCSIARAVKKVTCPVCGKNIANAYRKGHREGMHSEYSELHYLPVH